MTDPLTRLDEVDARAEAATEGPWVEANGMVMRSTFYGLAPVTGDAEFIAHARQDLPALCGHTWIPQRDPKPLPVCSKCLAIYQHDPHGHNDREDLPDA